MEALQGEDLRARLCVESCSAAEVSSQRQTGRRLATVLRTAQGREVKLKCITHVSASAVLGREHVWT